MKNERQEYHIFRDLLDAAKTIERWSLQQRKDYLFDLVKRELKEGKTLYRHAIKLMLVDSKKRKNFIRKINNGKIF